MNSKWMIDLNEKPKNIKLEKKIEHLFDLELDKDVSDMTPKNKI